MADKTILFVCTGNTCRSYMAQAIAENYLSAEKDGGTGVRILSAGTGAFDGEPPSPQALTVLAEMGIPARGHRSTCLTPDLIREADLILAMTRSQKNSVLRLEPQAGDKVFLLKEFASDREENVDILDPFGQPVEFYRDCATQLRVYVVKALEACLTGKDRPDNDKIKHINKKNLET